MSDLLDTFRAKYPAYDEVPDDKLTLAVGDKFPVYLNQDRGFQQDYNRLSFVRQRAADAARPAPYTVEEGIQAADEPPSDEALNVVNRRARFLDLLDTSNKFHQSVQAVTGQIPTEEQTADLNDQYSAVREKWQRYHNSPTFTPPQPEFGNPVTSFAGWTLDRAGNAVRGLTQDVASGWEPGPAEFAMGENLAAATLGEETPMDKRLKTVTYHDALFHKAAADLNGTITRMIPSLAVSGGVGTALKTAGMAELPASVVSAGGVFGLKPEGFDPEEGGKMALFPVASKIGERAVAGVLEKMGVELGTETAKEAFRMVGGFSASQAYMELLNARSYLDPNMSQEEKLGIFMQGLGMNLGMHLSAVPGLVKSAADDFKIQRAAMEEVRKATDEEAPPKMSRRAREVAADEPVKPRLAIGHEPGFGEVRVTDEDLQNKTQAQRDAEEEAVSQQIAQAWPLLTGEEKALVQIGRGFPSDIARRMQEAPAVEAPDAEAPTPEPEQEAPPRSQRRWDFESQGKRGWDLVDESKTRFRKISWKLIKEANPDWKPTGAAREIFAAEGVPADEAATVLHRSGHYRGDPGQVDQFGDAMNNAADGRKATRAAAAEEKQQVNRMAAQTERFEADQAHATAGTEVVSPEDLNEGDHFTLNGHKLKVTRLEYDEDGMVTGIELDDGNKYGTQRRGGDTYLRADKGSVVKQEAQPEEVFSPGPAQGGFFDKAESVEEQKARLVAEEERRGAHGQRAKMQDRINKPLTGSTGDLGQKDMFGGGDLFSSPGSVTTGKQGSHSLAEVASIAATDEQLSSSSFQSAPGVSTGRMPDFSDAQSLFQALPSRQAEIFDAAYRGHIDSQTARNVAQLADRELRSGVYGVNTTALDRYYEARGAWEEAHGGTAIDLDDIRRGWNNPAITIARAKLVNGKWIARDPAESAPSFLDRAAQEGRIKAFGLGSKIAASDYSWVGSDVVYVLENGRVIAAATDRPYEPYHDSQFEQAKHTAELAQSLVALADKFRAEPQARLGRGADTSSISVDVESRMAAGDAKRQQEVTTMWERLLNEKYGKQSSPFEAAWQSLTRFDDAFQFGKTTSSDIHDITKAVSTPQRAITAEVHGKTIELSSSKGSISIRNSDSRRPYIYAAEAGSSGKKQGGGAQLYQAAFDWAHNNGKVMRPDTALTDINSIRRTSNMFASALRWGTTAHMLPHSEQGVPWAGSDATRFRALAEKEASNVFASMPEAANWHWDNGQIKTAAGAVVSDAVVRRMVLQHSPSESGIGETTVKRAVLTNSINESLSRNAAVKLERLPGRMEHILYSPEGEGGAGGRPDEGPKAPEDDPKFSSFNAVPVELPEAVRFIKALTGVYPKVKEFFKALGGQAAGTFNAKTGRIEMRADQFDILTHEQIEQAREQAKEAWEEQQANATELKERGERLSSMDEILKDILHQMREESLDQNPVAALKVVWHEIGHLKDWLPDKMVRGRGNLFGHIAALQNHLDHVLPIDPARAAGKPLTPAEKRALAEEAERRLRAEMGPITEILRTIVSEEPEWRITGITVEDLKNIYREGGGKDTPELTRWFSEQDSKVKVDIIRKAMRGLLDERVAAMGKKEQIGTRTTTKTVREKVGREPTTEEIKKRFGELFRQEMRRRNLAQLEEVKAELESMIAWWRGTEQMEDYFKRPWEMYAEAFSVFMNNPAAAFKRAPKYFELINNYMQKRPAVAALYNQIQNEIKSGTVMKQRVKDLYEMWERDNARSIEVGRSRRKTSWRDFAENVSYHLDQTSGPIYRAAKGLEIEGRVRDARANWLYRGAEHERYFATSNREVGRRLAAANLDWNREFAEYLFHQRVQQERFVGSTPAGAAIANPLGWTTKNSGERLREMERELGPARWQALEEAAGKFHELHQEFVARPVAAARMFNELLNDVLVKRAAYVTFSKVKEQTDVGLEKMIEAQYGADVTPHIFRQVGNLGEIKNPATATMLKGASLISAVARNAMKREFIKALQASQSFPGELVKPAETRFTGKVTAPVVVDGPAVGTIVYLEDGQAHGFYVRKLAADAVNGASVVENRAASIGQAAKGLLKGLFTQNPGFWGANFVRDTAGFWAQMPGVRAPIGWAMALPRAARASYMRVKGEADAYADAALKRRLLISRAEQTGSWSEVNDEWEHRVSSYGIDPASWQGELTRTEQALKLWHQWMGWGKVIEGTNKIAAMIYLDEYAPDKFRNAPEWQKREWVRDLGGSPNFLERGKSANTIDWFFLFYNPWKEGVRSLVKAGRTDPGGALSKATAMMVFPTVLQALAYNGAFGDDLKQRMRKVPIYQLTNYMIPYVGWANDEKSLVGAWRLPLFEPHRILHGTLFQLLTGQSEGMLAHAGGQLPGLNPLIETTYQWANYMLGGNPSDWHRGVNVLTRQQQDARGGAFGRPGDVMNASALGQMAQQTWNNLGGTVLYRFRNLNLDSPPQTPLQKTLDAPVINGIAGRWYVVTDRGDADQAALAATPWAKREAAAWQKIDILLEHRLNGDQMTARDQELMGDPDVQMMLFLRAREVNDKVTQALAQRMSPAYRQMQRGRDNLQKAAILQGVK